MSVLHIVTYRIRADAEAREIHVATPHVRAFVERLYPLCTQEPLFRDLELVATTDHG